MYKIIGLHFVFFMVMASFPWALRIFSNSQNTPVDNIWTCKRQSSTGTGNILRYRACSVRCWCVVRVKNVNKTRNSTCLGETNSSKFRTKKVEEAGIYEHFGIDGMMLKKSELLSSLFLNMLISFFWLNDCGTAVMEFH
jgi:hypothetical protein